jgi:putative transposase
MHPAYCLRGAIPIVRLIGAILLEQNDDWAVRRARYVTMETIAPLNDDPTVSLPASAS